MSSTGADSYGDPRTRQRILETTWRLMEEQGASLRLGDVAQAADVSRQAIYLHFGDRTGLLVATVTYVDEALGLGDLVRPVREARTGLEALEHMVEVHSRYNGEIDSVARVLEADQHRDPALAAAWRDRMEGRRSAHRQIIQRIADEGHLAPGWTVESAADLFHVLTMPGPWRELTKSLGWSARRYADHTLRLLREGLLVSG